MKWYVGAKNDGLFIIDKPPRPSNDDVVDIPDVNVIATVSGNDRAASKRATLLAAAPTVTEALQFMAQEFEWLVSTGKVKGFDMTRGKARDALKEAGVIK